MKTHNQPGLISGFQYTIACGSYKTLRINVFLKVLFWKHVCLAVRQFLYHVKLLPHSRSEKASQRITRFGSGPPLCTSGSTLMIEENSDMRKIWIATFLTLFGMMLVLAPSANLLAQRLTGSATVEVLDPSGAAVPEARATLTSKDKGISLELKSGADGRLVVPDLAPGDYSINVKASGPIKVSGFPRIVVAPGLSILPPEFGLNRYCSKGQSRLESTFRPLV